MHCMRVSDAGRKRYLQRGDCVKLLKDARGVERGDIGGKVESKHNSSCLLYTSDAADE